MVASTWSTYLVDFSLQNLKYKIFVIVYFLNLIDFFTRCKIFDRSEPESNIALAITDSEQPRCDNLTTAVRNITDVPVFINRFMASGGLTVLGEVDFLVIFSHRAELRNIEQNIVENCQLLSAIICNINLEVIIFR